MFHNPTFINKTNIRVGLPSSVCSVSLCQEETKLNELLFENMDGWASTPGFGQGETVCL